MDDWSIISLTVAVTPATVAVMSDVFNEALLATTKILSLSQSTETLLILIGDAVVADAVLRKI